MAEPNNGHLIAAHEYYTEARKRISDNPPVITWLELAKVAALIGIGRELEAANNPLPFESDGELDDEGPTDGTGALAALRDPDLAFEDAIRAGVLSDNPYSIHFVHEYMYMCTKNNVDYFKHKLTRETITSPAK
jgi:hypothetical protein